MKKRYILWGVIAAAGIAGYSAIHVIKQETENAVRKALDSIPAQAQEITVSLLDRSLTVKGITYQVTSPFISDAATGTVDSIDIQGINPRLFLPKSLDKTPAPDELPQLADFVSIKNISQSMSQDDGQKVNLTVATLEVNGWKQRLGVLLDLYKKHNSKEFFAELCHFQLDSMKLADMKLIRTTGAEEKQMVALASLETTKPINTLSSEQFGPISFRLTDFNSTFSDSKTDLACSLAKFEFDDLTLPNPAYFMQVMQQNEKTADQRAVQDPGVLLAEFYTDRNIFSRILMEQLKITIDKLEVISIRHLLNVRDITGTQFKNEGRMEELSFNPDILPEQYKNIVKKFAPEGIVLSARNHDIVQKNDASMHTEMVLKGLADITITADIKGNGKLLYNPFYSASEKYLNEICNSILLKEFKLDYQDHGLLALTLQILAASEGMTPDALLQAAQQFLTDNKEELDTLYPNFSASLTTMLMNPGTCQIIFKPKLPLDLNTLLLLALLQPDKLPLTVNTEAGPKAITEYLSN